MGVLFCAPVLPFAPLLLYCIGVVAVLMSAVTGTVADDCAPAIKQDTVGVTRCSGDLPATQLVDGIGLWIFLPSAYLYQFDRLRLAGYLCSFLLLVRWAVITGNVMRSRCFLVF